MPKTVVKKERSTKNGVLTLSNEDKMPSATQYTEIKIGSQLVASGNWTPKEADIAFKTAFHAIGAA